MLAPPPHRVCVTRVAAMDPFTQGLDEASARRVQSWVEVRGRAGSGAQLSQCLIPERAPPSRRAQASKTPSSPYATLSTQPPAYGASSTTVRGVSGLGIGGAHTASTFARVHSHCARAPQRQASSGRQPTAPPWSPSPYKARARSARVRSATPRSR